MLKKVAVLVAGSWGSALANVLAENGHQVSLWTRSASQAKEINEQHSNLRYLKYGKLSPAIQATTDMEKALKDTAAVVIVSPSHAMREISRKAAPFMQHFPLLIHAAKGFETETMKRMSTVIAEETGYDVSKVVVLSGPSHAEEVIDHKPTTVVVAAELSSEAKIAQDLFINSYFRVYTNPDLRGVELAGALKNIIALGAGLSDGLGFGDNARAALITRGIAEISRLGKAMGADLATFSGLAGIGDLIVTCTSVHSRNWQAGSLLAKGKTMAQVLDEMDMVVEGIRTAKVAFSLAKQYEVNMPITEEIYQILFDNKPCQLAAEALMERDRKTER